MRISVVGAAVPRGGAIVDADANTGLSHFDSKWKIEQYLADSDLAWTVVRPVYIMQNFLMSHDDIVGDELALSLDEGVRLQLVDAAGTSRLRAGDRELGENRPFQSAPSSRRTVSTETTTAKRAFTRRSHR